MRINVYAEEYTDEFAVIEKTADTGATFRGIRLFLKSPESLHHRPDDDDRTAITFWIPSPKTGFRSGDGRKLAGLLRRMAEALDER